MIIYQKENISSIFVFLIEINMRLTGYEMIIYGTIHIPTRGE